MTERLLRAIGVSLLALLVLVAPGQCLARCMQQWVPQTTAKSADVPPCHQQNNDGKRTAPCQLAPEVFAETASTPVTRGHITFTTLVLDLPAPVLARTTYGTGVHAVGTATSPPPLQRTLRTIVLRI